VEAAEWSGGEWVEVAALGSGRDALPGGTLDAGRTVGWLALARTLVLQRSGREAPAEAVDNLARQLVAIPNHGYGYDLLLNLSADADLTQKIAPLRKAELLFSFMGFADQWANADAKYRINPAWVRMNEQPDNQRLNVLECSAIVAGGHLALSWSYSSSLHDGTTVEKVGESAMAFLRKYLSGAKTGTGRCQ
jgi:non-ribosomal peptide synthase protein (TIGR01720 family)